MIAPAHPLLSTLEPQRLICLDAEFADGAYMLELSISDARGQLIYCRRFKPARINRWDSYPHGITSDMVVHEPSFEECLPQISAIIDRADFITGFGLENDFRHLKAEGLRIPKEKKVVELREWFWILYGLDHGLDLTRRISNQSVAEHLGIEVEADKLHGSQYDIELSLHSLDTLLQRARLPEATDFAELYSKVMARYSVEKERYDREHSAGYCFIVQKANGYWVRASLTRPEPSPALIAMIEVENRKEAMVHLSQMFLNRISEGSFFIDRLSRAKLEKFKAYTNTFSAEDRDVYSKLMKLANKFQR